LILKENKNYYQNSCSNIKLKHAASRTCFLCLCLWVKFVYLTIWLLKEPYFPLSLPEWLCKEYEKCKQKTFCENWSFCVEAKQLPRSFRTDWFVCWCRNCLKRKEKKRSGQPFGFGFDTIRIRIRIRVNEFHRKKKSDAILRCQCCSQMQTY
jgi:hypothetical protein